MPAVSGFFDGGGHAEIAFLVSDSYRDRYELSINVLGGGIMIACLRIQPVRSFADSYRETYASIHAPSVCG